MSKFVKCFVSCLLAVMMMLSLFPLSAFASNDGNGASDDTSSPVSSEQSTTAVAKIGDKEYGTLQEAVNDAPADGTETTIELLSDTEVAAQITIKEGQNIIINANNKTLTLPSTNFQGRFFENKGTLTLTGNGIFDATNAGTKGYGTVNNFGTLTVINGTYTNLKDSGTFNFYNRNGGTATFVNPTINGGGGCIATEVNTTTTIQGGTFTSCTKTAIQIGNGNPAPDSGAGKNSTVMIYGGTFTGGDSAKTAIYVEQTNHAIGAAKIFGGTFSSDPTAYLKDGYGTTQADENWTVTATKPVAQIGDKQYASLEDAINAASSGDTITMLQNAKCRNHRCLHQRQEQLNN